MPNYWLLKSDPDTYGWPHLLADDNQSDHWEGVRNYQARNYIRSMKKGDQAFFYHSVIKPLAIFGTVRIIKEAYPDPTQFDSQSKYFDPKSNPDDPRWSVVDVQAHEEFDPPITMDELREVAGLENMVLLRKGSRLSIQPVTADEWRIVMSRRKKGKGRRAV